MKIIGISIHDTLLINYPALISHFVTHSKCYRQRGEMRDGEGDPTDV